MKTTGMKASRVDHAALLIQRLSLGTAPASEYFGLRSTSNMPQ